MKQILIISKESGQTQNFINGLSDYLEESETKFELEFAFYPRFEEKSTLKDWTIIALSPEVLAEEDEIKIHLKEIKPNIPIVMLDPFNYGMRRYNRIFPPLLA
jgi:cellobiose-specific phosphotransferase system component IIB